MIEQDGSISIPIPSGWQISSDKNSDCFIEFSCKIELSYFQKYVNSGTEKFEIIGSIPIQKSTLLPCPFCGGTDLIVGNTHTPSFSVDCQECEAQVHGEYFESKEPAYVHYDSDPVSQNTHTPETLPPAYKKAYDSAIQKWNTRI